MNTPSTRSLRRAVTVAAVALAGLIGGATPVLAAPISDGTSNTAQFGVTPVSTYTLNNTMISGFAGHVPALDIH